MDANSRRIQAGSVSSTVSNVFFASYFPGALAPLCMLTPGKIHGMNSVLCGTERYVPSRELNTAAKHMLNSNTWVILLMISPCLSALLDPSQSARCLAKLNGIKHHLCVEEKVRISPPPGAATSGWSVDPGECATCKTRLAFHRSGKPLLPPSENKLFLFNFK